MGGRRAFQPSGVVRLGGWCRNGGAFCSGVTRPARTPPGDNGPRPWAAVARGCNCGRTRRVLTETPMNTGVCSCIRAIAAKPIVPMSELCRCRHKIHKRRNILGHLPEHMHANVTAVLRDAWATGDAALAHRQLERLAASLKTDHPGAAASVREGLADTLMLQRFGIAGCRATPRHRRGETTTERAAVAAGRVKADPNTAAHRNTALRGAAVRRASFAHSRPSAPCAAKPKFRSESRGSHYY